MAYDIIIIGSGAGGLSAVVPLAQAGLRVLVREQSGAHSAGYEAMKEDLAWRMSQALEKRVPGISEHIVFWNLGTPLTNVHYINSTAIHLIC